MGQKQPQILPLPLRDAQGQSQDDRRGNGFVEDHRCVKSWRQSKRIALIESFNAAWVDLSRVWYDCEPTDYLRALDGMNS